MMEYKGYLGKVEFDDEAGIFHGQVINTSDVITFQGTSVGELRQAFVDSVDDYLEFCAERGDTPEKPFSGRFVVRMEPSLHRQIAIAASRAGQSINSWVTAQLRQAVDIRGTPGLAIVRHEYRQITVVERMETLSLELPIQPVMPPRYLPKRSSTAVRGLLTSSPMDIDLVVDTLDQEA